MKIRSWSAEKMVTRVPALRTFAQYNGGVMETMGKTDRDGGRRRVMRLPSDQELLQKSAEEIFERIQADRDRVPEQLKPMLAYIDDHLFDPSLNVNRLKEACGIRDNSIAIRFHAAVGKPPHAYISGCRLETASQLLVSTSLPIWKISDLTGFSSIQVFSRAFFRWANIRPSEYRRQRRSGNELRAASGETRDTYWQQAMSGTLHPKEAAELIRKLVGIYLGSETSSKPGRS